MDKDTQGIVRAVGLAENRRYLDGGFSRPVAERERSLVSTTQSLALCCALGIVICFRCLLRVRPSCPSSVSLYRPMRSLREVSRFC